MSIEEALKSLSSSKLDKPSFSNIAERATRRRRRRTALATASGLACAALLFVGVLAISGDDDPSPDLIIADDPERKDSPTTATPTTEEPVSEAPPSEPPVPRPDGVAFLEAGPNGLAAHNGTQIEQLHDQPTVFGFLVGDTLVFQERVDQYTLGDIHAREAGQKVLRLEETFPNSHKLHAAAPMIDGPPAMLISASGGANPESYRAELSLVPVDGSERTEFDVNGGWENIVNLAAWDGGELVAVTTTEELQLHTADGTRLASIPIEFDSNESFFGSLLWVDDQLWALDSTFDGGTHLRIRTFDEQLGVTRDELLKLSGDVPQAGFCFHSEVGPDGRLWCNQSAGGPIAIDLDSGATEEIGAQRTTRTWATELEPMASPDLETVLVECDWAGENLIHRSGDFDGDGIGEFLEVVDLSPTTISICGSTTSAASLNLENGNDLLAIDVVDIEGDGSDEISARGTSATAVLGLFLELRGDIFEYRKDQYDIASPTPEAGWPGKSAVCVDTDGDGLRDLVNIEYSLSSDDTEILWSDSVGRQGRIDRRTNPLQAWLTTGFSCGEVVVQGGVDQPDAIYAMTYDPTALTRITTKPDVVLLLQNEEVGKIASEDLSDPAAWVLDVESAAGFDGPFSALEILQRNLDTKTTLNPTTRCLGDLPEAPGELAAMTRIRIEPHAAPSCAAWFAVDLFVDDELDVIAVALDLWGA